MARICIVTGAHLCRNPRVVKEASALGHAGHEVVVLGPAFAEDLAAEDAALVRGEPWEHRVVVDLRPRVAPAWRRHLYRALRRGGTELVARVGWETPEALGYGARRTLAAARTVAADLTIGHQEVGTWVVHELMKEGRRVGADFEDWYSRDLLPEAQAERPLRLLRRTEAALVRHGSHVTTTSEALADALAEAYGGPRPRVVYNAFPWSDRDALDGHAPDRPDRTLPSLHWVSQTIGPGRGLDTLCAALRQVKHPVAVHLRGRASAPDEAWLRAQFPDDLGHRLYLHALVPPSELLSRIAEHDIGLALEESDPPSRDLTVTNKILHYLLGGLAVVATDTQGQVEVAAAAPDAVRLCRSGEVEGLAQQIDALVSQPVVLSEAKAAALLAAHDPFCWERQAEVLIESVAQALSETVKGPLDGTGSAPLV